MDFSGDFFDFIDIFVEEFGEVLLNLVILDLDGVSFDDEFNRLGGFDQSLDDGLFEWALIWLNVVSGSV